MAFRLKLFILDKWVGLSLILFEDSLYCCSVLVVALSHI